MTTDPSGARTADRIAQELHAAEYTLVITNPGSPEHETAVERVDRLTRELLDVVEMDPAHDEPTDG
jgi:hypothetical protein